MKSHLRTTTRAVFFMAAFSLILTLEPTWITPTLTTDPGAASSETDIRTQTIMVLPSTSGNEDDTASDKFSKFFQTSTEFLFPFQKSTAARTTLPFQTSSVISQPVHASTEETPALPAQTTDPAAVVISEDAVKQRFLLVLVTYANSESTAAVEHSQFVETLNLSQLPTNSTAHFLSTISLSKAFLSATEHGSLEPMSTPTVLPTEVNTALSNTTSQSMMDTSVNPRESNHTTSTDTSVNPRDSNHTASTDTSVNPRNRNHTSSTDTSINPRNSNHTASTDTFVNPRDSNHTTPNKSWQYSTISTAGGGCAPTESTSNSSPLTTEPETEMPTLYTIYLSMITESISSEGGKYSVSAHPLHFSEVPSPSQQPSDSSTQIWASSSWRESVNESIVSSMPSLLFVKATSTIPHLAIEHAAQLGNGEGATYENLVTSDSTFKDVVEFTSAQSLESTFISTAVQHPSSNTTKAVNASSSNATNIWNTSSSNNTDFWNTSRGSITNIWNTTLSDITRAWNTSQNNTTNAWNMPASNTTQVLHKSLHNATSVWNESSSDTTGMRDISLRHTTHGWSTSLRDTTSDWNTSFTNTTNVWNKSSNNTTNIWNTTVDTISSVWNVALSNTTDIWNMSSQNNTDSWNISTQNTNDTWNMSSQNTTDTWNISTQNTNDTWNMLSQNTTDTWNMSSQNTTDTWNMSSQNTTDTWNMSSQNTTDTWNMSSQNTTDTWNMSSQNISGVINTSLSNKRNVQKLSPGNVSNVWNTLQTPGVLNTSLSKTLNVWNISLSNVTDMWDSNITDVSNTSLSNAADVRNTSLSNIADVLNTSLSNTLDVLNTSLSNIAEISNTSLNNIADIWNTSLSNTTDVLNLSLSNITNVWNTSLSNITNVWNTSLSNITNVWNTSLSNITDVLNLSLSNTTKVLNTSLSSTAGSWDMSLSNITDIWNTSLSNIKEASKTSLKSITNAWNTSLRNVTDFRNTSLSNATFVRDESVTTLDVKPPVSRNSGSDESTSVSKSFSRYLDASPPPSPQSNWRRKIWDLFETTSPAVPGGSSVDDPGKHNTGSDCSPWFVCVHGICSGMSCACHEGWVGLFCQVPCPVDCAPHGVCSTGGADQAMCVCNETSMYVSGDGCVGKLTERNEYAIKQNNGTANSTSELNRDSTSELSRDSNSEISRDNKSELNRDGKSTQFAGYSDVSTHSSRQFSSTAPNWDFGPIFMPDIFTADENLPPPETDKSATGGNATSKSFESTSFASDEVASSLNHSRHLDSPTSSQLTSNVTVDYFWGAPSLHTSPESFASPTTTTRPQEEPAGNENDCLPWFVCVNGNCSGMSCICKDGWAGLFCQEPCPTDCAPFGTCVTSSTNQAICVCNETSKYIQAVGCVTKPPEPPTAATSAPDTTAAHLRPAEERDCFGVFVCQHGFCEPNLLTCSCDRGWKGQLCDQACDVDCGEHGRCQENYEFSQTYCQCDYNYMGEYCETEVIVDSYTSTPTAASESGNATAAGEAGKTKTTPIPPVVREVEEIDLSAFGLDRSFRPDTEAPPRVTETTRQKFYPFSAATGTSEVPAVATGAFTTPGFTTAAASTTAASTTARSTTAASTTAASTTAGSTTAASTTAGSTTAASTTAATLRPMTERECMAGFVCEHGYCGNVQPSCVCDESWGGALCDVPCPLVCGSNGTCVVFAGGSPFCRYDTISNKTSASPAPSNKIMNPDDPWEHLVPRWGQLPPLSQRLCHPGFTCAYGNCSQKESGVVVCVCEPEFAGTNCQITCPGKCGPRETCKYDFVQEIAYCSCDHKPAGPNCSQALTVDDDGRDGDDDDNDDEGSLSIVWPVSLAAAVLLVTLLFVALPVLLYRKRNITMMKIVYWFQSFEEDDSMVYDAFVSYASMDQDRQFVLQTLVPILEGRMCFTLCIQQCNFSSGAAIPDSLVDAARKSRRTLLILSPASVSFGWCRLEYQMVLQEMLNEKHKILPILIGDIKSVKNGLDNRLQSMLKTAPWFEYPSKTASEQEYHKFWRRLQLSLPKKRSSQLEEGKNKTCLVLPSALWSPDSLELRYFPTGHRPNVASSVSLCELESETDSQISEGSLSKDSQDVNFDDLSATPSLSCHSSGSILPESTCTGERISETDNSDSGKISQQSDIPSLKEETEELDSASSGSQNESLETVTDNDSSESPDVPSCVIDSDVGNKDLKTEEIKDE